MKKDNRRYKWMVLLLLLLLAISLLLGSQFLNRNSLHTNGSSNYRMKNSNGSLNSMEEDPKYGIVFEEQEACFVGESQLSDDEKAISCGTMQPKSGPIHSPTISIIRGSSNMVWDSELVGDQSSFTNIDLSTSLESKESRDDCSSLNIDDNSPENICDEAIQDAQNPVVSLDIDVLEVDSDTCMASERYFCLKIRGTNDSKVENLCKNPHKSDNLESRYDETENMNITYIIWHNQQKHLSLGVYGKLVPSIHLSVSSRSICNHGRFKLIFDPQESDIDPRKMVLLGINCAIPIQYNLSYVNNKVLCTDFDTSDKEQENHNISLIHQQDPKHLSTTSTSEKNCAELPDIEVQNSGDDSGGIGCEENTERSFTQTRIKNRSSKLRTGNKTVEIEKSLRKSIYNSVLDAVVGCIVNSMTTIHLDIAPEIITSDVEMVFECIVENAV